MCEEDPQNTPDNQPIPKAVLWDMDGTLVRTEELMVAAFEEALKIIGQSYQSYTVPTREQLRQLIVGRSNLAALNILIARTPFLGSERGRLIELIDENFNLSFELLLKYDLGQILIMPSIILFKRLLHEGYQVAIVSGSSREDIQLYLKLFNISSADIQKILIVGSDCYVKGKPDPEPYNTALKALGVEPSECIVIEDSEHGVTSATRAKLRVCGLVGTCTEQQLRACGATIVVETLAEMEHYFPEAKMKHYSPKSAQLSRRAKL